MPTELEAKHNALKILCSYLLYERKQETQLSMAYAILVQERHNQFHTTGGAKDGDGTNFADCNNEHCRMAVRVIQASRSMAVEINDVTIQLIAPYSLHVDKQGRSMVAFLKPKLEQKHEGEQVTSGGIIIPGSN